MKHISTLIVAIAILLTARAHNPQLASLKLLQEGSDRWSALIAVPFTACQDALQNNYPNLNIDSIDINLFNDLLREIIQQKSLFIINSSDTLTLSEAKIKPGHETEIYFQINKSVGKINALKVVFNSFASLKVQNTIFSIYQGGKSAGNFVLNTQNKYTLSLQNNAEVFSVIDQPNAAESNAGTSIAIISTILLPVVFFSYKAFTNS